MHCAISTAYFVSFGPHGPRKPITASGQGAKTLAGVAALLGVTTVVYYLMRANGKSALVPIQTAHEVCAYAYTFLISLSHILPRISTFAYIPTGGAPVKTMTKEWQEASNQIAIKQKQNPITGISSENYQGKGHVQSA